jgi:hypothetical protein
MKDFIEWNETANLKETAEVRDKATLVINPRKPPAL